MHRAHWPQWIGILASVAVLIVGFTASTHASGLGASKITLRLWDQQQSAKNIQDAYASALRAFEKANPNIKVQITTFPYAQYRDKLLVAARGGTAPDVMSLDEIWTPEFAAAGVIEPLDSYIKKSSAVKPNNFFKGAWDTNRWHGQIWGIPLNFDVWEQMYYNASMFKKAGLNPNKAPTTWPQWLAAAKKLTKAPKQFGVALLGHKGEDTVVMLDSLLYSNGGAIVKGSRVVINSPQNQATLTLYKNLSRYAPAGVANMDEATAASLFQAGKVAMILDGSWQQDTFKQAVKFDWRIAVPPAPAGKRFIGALGGWNLAINKSGSNRDAAFKLIEFLTTHKNVQETISSLTPGLKVAGLSFVRSKRKEASVILTTLTTGRPRPISPVYPQVSDIEQSMVQSVLGGTSVKSALASAQSQMTSAVKQSP